MPILGSGDGDATSVFSSVGVRVKVGEAVGGDSVLDVIAVTDHNEIWGSLEAREICSGEMSVQEAGKPVEV